MIDHPRTAEPEPPPALIAMPGEHPWPELEDAAGEPAPATVVDDLGDPL